MAGREGPRDLSVKGQRISGAQAGGRAPPPAASPEEFLPDWRVRDPSDWRDDGGDLVGRWAGARGLRGGRSPSEAFRSAGRGVGTGDRGPGRGGGEGESRGAVGPPRALQRCPRLDEGHAPPPHTVRQEKAGWGEVPQSRSGFPSRGDVFGHQGSAGAIELQRMITHFAK